MQDKSPAGPRAKEGWKPCSTEQSKKRGHEAKHEHEEAVEEEAPPIRMKKEKLSDVPCKIPRFQYVDFPSLHQCIRQLAVPPLDSWLGRCPPQWPASSISGDTGGRAPKFKYVDYPSLHHCIQQLSVPPLESWSSRLLQGEVHGDKSTKVQVGSADPLTHGPVKQEQADGAEGVAQTNRLDAVAMLPVDQPAENTDVSHLTPCEPQVLSGSNEDQAKSEMGYKGNLSARCFGPKMRSTCLAMAQLDTDEERLPVYGPCSKVKHDQKFPGGPAELRDCPQPVLWTTVPEAVCPFCQKMFADLNELKVHQRSHRHKKPH